MGERGFTLIEVLLAIAILTIAVLGVAGATALQSGIGAGLTIGQAAVTRGNYVTTATMLAQERLEQLKRLTYTLSTDNISPDPTPTGFEDEDFNSISGYANFRREVRVQTGVPASNMKTITVTVKMKLPKEFGIGPQESVSISTLIAARP